MADDYPLTHTLMFLKNKRTGSVPNLIFFQNRPPSYYHVDQYCEYTYEKKEKTNMSGDNIRLLEKI